MHCNPAEQWGRKYDMLRLWILCVCSRRGEFRSGLGALQKAFPLTCSVTLSQDSCGAQQAPLSGQHGTHSGPQLSKAAGVVHSPRPGPQPEAHVWDWQGEIQQAQVYIVLKHLFAQNRMHVDVFDVFNKVVFTLFSHHIKMICMALWRAHQTFTQWQSNASCLDTDTYTHLQQPHTENWGWRYSSGLLQKSHHRGSYEIVGWHGNLNSTWTISRSVPPPSSKWGFVHQLCSSAVYWHGTDIYCFFRPSQEALRLPERGCLLERRSTSLRCSLLISHNFNHSCFYLFKKLTLNTVKAFTSLSQTMEAARIIPSATMLIVRFCAY